MTVTYASNLRRFNWENLQVDDDLGRVEGSIGAQNVQAHAFAIDDDARRYLDGIPGVGPTVPPSLVINDLLKTYLLGYDCTPPMIGGGGLHTRVLIDIEAPVPLDTPLTITGRHIAKYTRRGRRYRSAIGEAAFADGTVAVRTLTTETVGYEPDPSIPDEGEVPANWAAELPRISPEPPAGARTASPGDELAEGDLLGPQAHPVSLEQSVVFSGFPFAWAHDEPQPVRQGTHTNIDIAKSAGFPVPLVQALLSASHHVSMLIDYYGERAFRGAGLSLAFTAPVLVGDVLTTHAVVVGDRSFDGVDYQLLEVVTRRGDGVAVTVGHARIRR